MNGVGSVNGLLAAGEGLSVVDPGRNGHGDSEIPPEEAGPDGEALVGDLPATERPDEAPPAEVLGELPDEPGEGWEAEVEAEAETDVGLESIARIEEHEGLEDHVRMYLREIGTVPLL